MSVSSEVIFCKLSGLLASWQTIYTICELESHLRYPYTLFVVVYKENLCSYQGWEFFFFFFECSYYFNPLLMAALYNLGYSQMEQTHTYILPVKVCSL